MWTPRYIGISTREQGIFPSFSILYMSSTEQCPELTCNFFSPIINIPIFPLSIPNDLIGESVDTGLLVRIVLPSLIRADVLPPVLDSRARSYRRGARIPPLHLGARGPTLPGGVPFWKGRWFSWPQDAPKLSIVRGSGVRNSLSSLPASLTAPLEHPSWRGWHLEVL